MTSLLFTIPGWAAIALIAILPAWWPCEATGGDERIVRSLEVALELVPVVQEGLQSPLFVTHAGDGSGQLYVVEQA
ncbi:MAG TPA: hypothetical protein VF819_09845, partial [Nitrospira sp.]